MSTLPHRNYAFLFDIKVLWTRVIERSFSLAAPSQYRDRLYERFKNEIGCYPGVDRHVISPRPPGVRQLLDQRPRQAEPCFEPVVHQPGRPHELRVVIQVQEGISPPAAPGARTVPWRWLPAPTAHRRAELPKPRPKGRGFCVWRAEGGGCAVRARRQEGARVCRAFAPCDRRSPGVRT